MAIALTVPQAMAALVLGVAGVAKLRAPTGAARAVSVAPILIRAFATGELGLGIWVLAGGGLAPGLLMALVYSGFAALTLRLARAGEACGCFGAPSNPASPLQSLLSAALAGVSLVAALAGAHGAGWILGRPPGAATVLGLGTAGAVYGVVLAYSELPQLWRSWSTV